MARTPPRRKCYRADTNRIRHRRLCLERLETRNVLASLFLDQHQLADSEALSQVNYSCPAMEGEQEASLLVNLASIQNTMPTIAAGFQIAGQRGAFVEVPLTITETSGLTEIVLFLSYNTNILDLPSGLNAGSIQLATSLAQDGDWNLETEVDEGAGIARISLIRALPSPTVSGELLRIAFWVKPTAASGPTIIDVSGVAEMPPFHFTYSDGSIDIAPSGPQISAIYIDSTGWSQSFRDYVDGGLDDGGTNDNGIDDGVSDRARGYLMPAGALQSEALPWIKMDRMKVAFSSNVSSSLQSSDFQLVRANGFLALQTNGLPGVIPTIDLIGYDLATNIATLALSQPFEASVIDLIINSNGINDTAGNLLDGEWPSPLHPSAYPSGDGTRGGQFIFRLFLLPGDVAPVSNRAVNSADVVYARGAQNQVALIGFGVTDDYDFRADVDGNGGVNSADLVSVRQRQNAVIFTLASPLVAIRSDNDARLLPSVTTHASSTDAIEIAIDTHDANEPLDIQDDPKSPTLVRSVSNIRTQRLTLRVLGRNSL